MQFVCGRGVEFLGQSEFLKREREEWNSCSLSTATVTSFVRLRRKLKL